MITLKEFLVKAVSVILIITLFITSYIAFVIFLCCSVQLLLSYFVSFITCALIKDWFKFSNILLWVIFSVPYIHLTIGINFKVLISYFNNIWNVLSFKGIQNTIRSDFEKGKWSKTINIIKYLLITCVVFVLGTFLIIELFSSSEENNYSYYIGIISCIPPVYGFLKVLYKSAYSIFVDPKLLTVSLNNIDDLKTSINDTKEIIEVVDDSETNENKINKKKSKKEIIDDSQDESEVSTKSNVQQSLIDPCGVMNQTEYLNFINDSDVNHFSSAAITKKFDIKMIPGLVITLFVFTSIIVNTYSFVSGKEYKVGQLIAAYILRILFYIVSTPFLMIFNFAGLFIDSKETKEKHSFIRKMWIFVLAFYIIFLLLAIITVLTINFGYHPFELKNFVYNPAFINQSKSVHFSDPAAICDVKLHGLNLLQYSGIAALGQSRDLKLSGEIIKYLFDGELKEFKISGNDYAFAYQVKIDDSLYVVAFNALIDKDGISFLLENFFNDFILYKIFNAIVPFYTIAHDVFLSRFLNILAERLSLYIGATQVTPRYIDFNIDIYNRLKLKNVSSIYIGHSIGGMLAKSVGDSYNVPSVAFESLNYYRSLFHASMEVYTGQSVFTTNGFEMINLYSPSQFFAASEANATLNIKLPKWKSYLDSANPYDTMCTIAAGCLTDMRFDDFCNYTIGFNNYLHLFKLWNRTRSDMP